MTFRIESETLIIGRENALLRAEDLNAVIATADAAAGKNARTMTAERVLVIDSASISTPRGEEGVPGSFTLAQNCPNPFNATTNIMFELNPSTAGDEMSNRRRQFVYLRSHLFKRSLTAAPAAVS